MARDKIVMEWCKPGDRYNAFECDTSYTGVADENGRVEMLPITSDNREDALKFLADEGQKCDAIIDLKEPTDV